MVQRGNLFRRVNNGLQSRRGGRHRQCRARDARHSGRAGFSRRRSGGAGLAQEHGAGVLVRRQDAEGEGARPLRFFRRRYLPDVGGRRGVEGMVAEDRRGGRGGDRQFLGLAHGPGRAADRAGGERRRGRRLPQEEHHRQSELLDRPARGRAQAAARQGHDQARGGGDLSIGVGRRQGGDGRAVLADQGGVHARRGRRTRSFPSASPST